MIISCIRYSNCWIFGIIGFCHRKAWISIWERENTSCHPLPELCEEFENVDWILRINYVYMCIAHWMRCTTEMLRSTFELFRRNHVPWEKIQKCSTISSLYKTHETSISIRLFSYFQLKKVFSLVSTLLHRKYILCAHNRKLQTRLIL